MRRFDTSRSCDGAPWRRHVRLTAGIALLASLAVAPARACGPLLPTMILHDDPTMANHAIESYRAMGPRGLALLMEAFADDLARHAEAPRGDDPRWQRISAALNAVAAQYDAHASGLYWYTDWERAHQASLSSGKPILSLRLLGYLHEECSCANSRFFRTALYANAEVSRTLREQFVLHWQSVRPVPKVTIDFGDGRRLERTLTGNSIHYVLDADGTVLDALPGLYGPQAFHEWLSGARQLWSSVRGLTPDEAAARRMAYHRDRQARIAEAWQRDLAQLGVSVGSGPLADARNAALEALAAGNRPAVPAEIAVLLAKPKGGVERPLLDRMAYRASRPPDASALEQATSDELWERLAELHAGEAQLDTGSVRLMREHHPTAGQAGALAITKRRVEDPLLRVVAAFQRSIALDTVRNEYLLHRRIHEWLAEGQMPADVDAFNREVYARLFLTPESDPWLGLVRDDVYSALRGDGRVVPDEAP